MFVVQKTKFLDCRNPIKSFTKLVCPGCGKSYIEKMDCRLIICLSEHGSHNDQRLCFYILLIVTPSVIAFPCLDSLEGMMTPDKE